MTRAIFHKYIELLADQSDAASAGILKGCEKLAGGKFRGAKRHPRLPMKNLLHPEGVQEYNRREPQFCHPFRMDNFCFPVSGGVTRRGGFNPRLISGKPSACSRPDQHL